MKKLIKYLSIIIVVIALSATVYIKTSSNDSVQMQNKEALAEEPLPRVHCMIIGVVCVVAVETDDGGIITFGIPYQHNS